MSSIASSTTYKKGLTALTLSDALFIIGGMLVSISGYALYLGFKARASRSTSQPKFTSAKESNHKAEYTPASEAEIVGFQRIDEVLGKVTVDGVPYRTFDAGEVLIYDKKNRPVIAFKVDGYGNDQRSINYIKVSEHIDKVNGVIFYVKHNPADLQLFTDWLNQQMYGGDYAREALHFKDLMTEVAKFNQLLASRKLRKTTGKYVTY